jgi:hypothetical protein
VETSREVFAEYLEIFLAEYFDLEEVYFDAIDLEEFEGFAVCSAISSKLIKFMCMILKLRMSEEI